MLVLLMLLGMMIELMFVVDAVQSVVPIYQIFQSIYETSRLFAYVVDPEKVNHQHCPYLLINQLNLLTFDLEYFFPISAMNKQNGSFELRNSSGLLTALSQSSANSFNDIIDFVKAFNSLLLPLNNTEHLIQCCSRAVLSI